ncbi:MAG TPA: S-adenosylmethionine:tRNA ribosyltransferase-isomerase [Anaerolineae bacterium]
MSEPQVFGRGEYVLRAGRDDPAGVKVGGARERTARQRAADAAEGHLVGFPEQRALARAQGRGPARQAAGVARPDWDFILPPDRQAHEPPEARGLARDAVRLLISDRATGALTHTIFRELPRFLDPGDLLVINTSGTLSAALPATAPDGRTLEMHLSTHLPSGLWTLELRQYTTAGSRPFYTAEAGEFYTLPAGAVATLIAPYGGTEAGAGPPRRRLWLANLTLPLLQDEYLARYGAPIRYDYVPKRWPASYYQTVYATEPGSAEMPSAGRAFSPEVLAQLIARGVWIAPLLLHTGVGSLEADELPYEEFYRVPEGTAYLINAARERGRRVIAVGTTVVRAVETVADEHGAVHPGEGWTGLVVTTGYRLRAITALLTGLHEPRSTHLAMLEAVAGRDHLRRVYDEALAQGYLWHEFGDLHLIL